MVNPRDHRVVVIESLLCPSHFRNTLARVLFNHLNVSCTCICCTHQGWSCVQYSVHRFLVGWSRYGAGASGNITKSSMGMNMQIVEHTCTYTVQSSYIYMYHRKYLELFFPVGSYMQASCHLRRGSHYSLTGRDVLPCNSRNITTCRLPGCTYMYMYNRLFLVLGF